MPDAEPPPLSGLRTWAALFVLIALLLLGGGYWYFRAETQEIREEKQQALSAIAALKSGQLVQWRKDRLGDARRSADSPFFRRAVAAWLRNTSDLGLREDWHKRLSLECESYGYVDALLFDAEGRMLLAAHGAPGVLDPVLSQAFKQAVAQRQAVLSDFYRDAHGIVHVDAVAPVWDESGSLLAVLVLQTNAETYLYPLIQTWPTVSPSAETLLIRREGDEVIFLNELRHQRRSALTLRQPLTLTTLPAVQAVMGRTGCFEGLDYRGVPVLADLRTIPGSPWSMVTKVDTREILAEARYRAVFIAVAVGCLILLSGALIALAYRQRQAGLYRGLYELERAQREAEELFRTTLYSIGDAVITTDPEGRVRQMNPVAERLTGWLEAEARDKPLDEVFHIVNEETRKAVESPVLHVLREGQVVGLANHTILIARDGAERPIADSGAPIRAKDGGLIGVVLVFRDQSAEQAAQRALRRSEAKLKAALASMTDAIIIADAAGHFHDFNDAFATFHRFASKEDCAQTFAEYPEILEVYAPDGTLVPLEMWAVPRALRGETVSNAEYTLRRKDTGETWVGSYSFGPIRNKEGEIIGAVVAARDVTARKQAEEALRDSEERMRLFIEHAPAALAMFDRQMRYLHVSRRWLNDYQLVGRELLGQSHYDVFPEIPERWREIHRRALSGEVVRAEEDPFLRADGTTQWLRWEVRPWHDASGQVAGIVVFSEDISIGKQAQQDLRESETRFRTLFETMSEGFCLLEMICDAERRPCDARPLLVNPAFERHSGVAAAALLSQTLHQVFPELPSRWFERYGRVARSGESFHFIDQFGPQGRWFEISAYQTQPGVVAVLFHDITERRRAEEDRTRLESLLSQTQKMESVGRLAGGVAHDFNNMLNVILGYAELALDQLSPSDALSGNIQEIIHAGRRSAELTSQLLAFARKQTIQPKVLELNETIDGMLKMLSRLIGEEIELLWKPASAPATVKLDPTQLHQILINLTVNARDAIAGVGQITIETALAELNDDDLQVSLGASPGHYVVLSISDDGRGMDLATQAHLFEPFFTTKPQGEGTGLGLATVYGIVKQNNGFIRVYSEPDHGTSFHIYLPGQAAAEPVAQVPVARPAMPGGAETILLVEDEQSLLELSHKMLARLGYTVLAAGSPRRALELAAEYTGEIHLVLSDVVMPEMSGRELQEQLSALRPEMKWLFTSGYTADVIAHRGVLEPNVHFLHKPFTHHLLAEKIREVLGEPAGHGEG